MVASLPLLAQEVKTHLPYFKIHPPYFKIHPHKLNIHGVDIELTVDLEILGGGYWWILKLWVGVDLEVLGVVDLELRGWILTL